MMYIIAIIAIVPIISYGLYALNTWIDKTDLERKYLEKLLEEEFKDGPYRKI